MYSLVVLVVTICPSFQSRDYATNKWTLKHIISTLKVFEKTNIKFGYMDYDSAYTMITIHPEWNLIFFMVTPKTFNYKLAINFEHLFNSYVFLTRLNNKYWINKINYKD